MVTRRWVSLHTVWSLEAKLESLGMSLLTETSPPVKLQGKRMFEEGDYQSRKTTPPFKRSNVSIRRKFPSNCGPFAPNGKRGIQDLSGGEKSPNLASDENVVEAKPLRVFVPPDANFEYMKPPVPDDCKMDSMKHKFMPKDDEKPYPAVAFGKVISENEARDDTAPKASEDLEDLNASSKEPDPAVASGKVISENEAGDDIASKASEDLEDLNASSEPLKFASKYPLSKVRKGVTITRDFPSNCRGDQISISDMAMDNGRKSSETKPCGLVAESSDKLINEDDDEDCVIIKEQQTTICNGNMVEEQHESNLVTGSITSKQVQEHYKCDFDWIEDEMYDEEICIITPSEWNQLQSGFKCQNASKKDNGDEPLVEEMENHSEEYNTETFAEPKADTTIENCNEEPNAKELENLCIVPYDAEWTIVTQHKVQEALKLFEELYNKLVQEYKAEAKGGKVTKQIHTEAANLLKNQQKWVNIQPTFGHVPGVEVGDEFQFRVQLAMVGLHHEFISGINCVTVDGKKFANSVVDSGRYENKVLSRDVIIYSGQGGNPKVLNLTEKCQDQKLEGANLALKNSKEASLPVRVIRKTSLGHRKMYIYEGLYTVTNFWQERTRTDKLAFMFEMVRISGQPDGTCLKINEPRTSTGYLEQSNSAVADDVSQGKEKIPIRIVNDMSHDKPQPFTYITKMKYPDWYRISEPDGCNCIGGCSDSKPCYCAYKNGGEIPFNEEGSILKAKRLVHECGPSCKCPPSCQNRVSQRGPRFQLEVFKTKSTGWGVRSREDIPSGSFLCEYIGEVLPDREAEQRTNDEYLFDLDDCDGFTIDAARYGNVGRFINHSCFPNLYAQNVVYDNEDKSLPHIMLFATKKIPALQELCYDYNYKVDRVCDSNGNIKKKICHCGSRKCTGRMY